MAQSPKTMLWIVVAVLLIADRSIAYYVGNLSDKPFEEMLFSGSPIFQFVSAALEVTESYLVNHEKSLMVIGTLAVAIFTWTLYRTARDQLKASSDALSLSEKSIRVTEQTLIASQRPWLSVEAGLAGPLRITESEVRVEVGFTIKNVGKSPAINVQIEPLLVSGMNKTEQEHVIARTQRLAEDIKKRPLADESILGQTIFPGEVLRQSIGLGIRIDELRASIPDGMTLDMFGLELAGYVTYRTPFNDGIHLTHFSGTIGRHHPERPHMHMLFNFSEAQLEPGEYGIWANPFISGRVN